MSHGQKLWSQDIGTNHGHKAWSYVLTTVLVAGTGISIGRDRCIGTCTGIGTGIGTGTGAFTDTWLGTQQVKL